MLTRIGVPMSDAREWLNAAVVTDPATTVACQNALLAVLDLHVPATYDFGIVDCNICVGDGWPCATVLVINKALGVSDE